MRHKITKTAEAMELIQKKVDEIQSDKAYREFLKTQAKFPMYSWRNQVLIHAQDPNATLVCAYGLWAQQGRHVKKGSKALRIIAPMKVKDDETGEERRVFRAVPVFDVAQTEGKPLPENPLRCQELEGDVKDFDKLFPALCAISGYVVNFVVEIIGDAYGLTDFRDRRIDIRDDLSQAQTFKTMVHETAHALMHNRGLDREFSEMEAESVAFIVCRYFGINSIDYSAPYIAGWKGERTWFIPRIEAIQRTSAHIIKKLETALA